MTFLEKLKKAGKSTNKDYTAFIRAYRKRDTTIHLFYEGYEDPAFYGSAIRQVINNDRKVYFHRASNKREVYKYFELLDWRSYDKKRVLFLVDKDYSDLLGFQYPKSDNIYVTEYYSIENYIVNETTLERVIIELCRGNDPELVETVLGRFKISHSSFVKSILLISGYILFHKKNGGATQLNNINLNHLIAVSEELDYSLVQKPQNDSKITYLDNRVQVVTPAGSWKAILDEIKALKQIAQPKIWIRGKYEIWFFVNFINKVIELLKNQAGVNLRNPQINQGNALVNLSAISDKPISLIEFFNERLK